MVFTFNSLQTKKNQPYYYGTSSRIVFVCFLGELKTPKRYFEINWPLVHFQIDGLLKKTCYLKKPWVNEHNYHSVCFFLLFSCLQKTRALTLIVIEPHNLRLPVFLNTSFTPSFIEERFRMSMSEKVGFPVGTSHVKVWQANCFIMIVGQQIIEIQKASNY